MAIATEHRRQNKSMANGALNELALISEHFFWERAIVSLMKPFQQLAE